MKILIAGASGLIGSKLAESFVSKGFLVHRLQRSSHKTNTLTWNPEAGQIDLSALDEVDVIINLSGENIADGRWTPARKKRILQSRIASNSLLVEELLKRDKKPSLYISASAVGYYGDCGDREVDEDAECGRGFLADVCRQWEQTNEPARTAGIRVVSLRFGMVLSAEGGALRKMRTPFRMGLGGRIGDGSQYMSWISLEDVCGAVQHIIENKSLVGAVNLVSPQAVRNADFVRTLASVLKRPAVLPLPAFAARMMFGEMADELLLSSIRVKPAKLLETPYRFKHPELKMALESIL